MVAYGRMREAPRDVSDIKGDLTAQAESLLMDAFAKASTPTTTSIILNFSGLTYTNSSGLGLMVTLVVRANRQRIRLFGYGLNEHSREIFALTRLDEAIRVYRDEDVALAAATSADLGAARPSARSADNAGDRASLSDRAVPGD
jgi:anti-sigma B factor antagonist